MWGTRPRHRRRARPSTLWVALASVVALAVAVAVPPSAVADQGTDAALVAGVDAPLAGSDGAAPTGPASGGEQGDLAPDAAPAPSEVTLSGHVLDGSGQPAVGVEVAVSDVGATVASTDATGTADTDATVSTGTDATGAFALRLAPGEYELRLGAVGGAAIPTFTVTAPHPVVLSADRVLDVRLSGGVQGLRVLAADGSPVAGATVRVTGDGGEVSVGDASQTPAPLPAPADPAPAVTADLETGASWSQEGVTDADGRVTLPVLAGPGTVVVTPAPGSTLPSAALPFVVDLGATVTVVPWPVGATTTALEVSPVPPVADRPVTLRASVRAVAGGLASGTVRFREGGTTLGVASLDPSGVATLPTRLALGDRALSATYVPDQPAFRTSVGVAAVTVAPAPLRPAQPPTLVRDPADPTTATVTWEPARPDAAHTVIGYAVTADPPGPACTTTGALSCTLTGLDPAVTYDVAVAATTAAITGGVPTQTTVRAAQDPGAPGSVRVTATVQVAEGVTLPDSDAAAGHVPQGRVTVSANGHPVLAVAVDDSGTATVSSNAVRPGDVLVASFDGSDPFLASSSDPLTWASATAGQPTDPQTVTVTIPAGAILISTPYTPDHPLELGEAVLDPRDSTFAASAPFEDITITDTRAGALGWTASLVSSPFTGPAKVDPLTHEVVVDPATHEAVHDSFPARHAGLTGLTRVSVPGNAADDHPVGLVDRAPYVDGLDVPKAFATYGEHLSLGTVRLRGDFGIAEVPSSVTPGRYTATLTFTAI